ncbi:MAG: TlpA family protein disulfide reductase [Prevotellaceae bacterium]|nr:TlpA family protein disulfide reductase [Prevotellaceae bacterium]
MTRSLFPLCCLALCACSERRPAVVLRPAFDVRNTRALEIDKIELTDSATIFYFDAFHLPKNWNRIDSNTYLRESGSDAKWTVVKAEGLELGKPFQKPDSGTVSFKLFFPPLPPTVSRVDFIESDCESCFKFWGIRLLPSDKVSIVPAPATAAVEALPPVRYNPQLTHISGQLVGYLREMKPDAEMRLRLKNMVTAEDINVVLPVADDGSFSVEVIVPQPSFTALTSNFRFTFLPFRAELFIVPGKDVNVLIDLRKQSRLNSLYRTDKSPEDSTYSYPSGSYLTAQDLHALNSAPRTFSYAAIASATAGMNPIEYTKYVLGELNEKLSQIRQAGYSPSAQAVAESRLKFAALSLLIEETKASSDGGISITITPRNIDSTRHLFMGELLNGSMLASGGAVVDYICIKKPIELASLQRQPNDPPSAFIKKHVVSLLGVDTGAVYALAMARFCSSTMLAGSYTADDKALLKSALIPEYEQVLLDANDSAAKELAAIKPDANITINELPDVPKEKAFDAMLAKYRGKVVLVDFWNTWCAPCVKGHKDILPLKAELKGKDVVFVYVADESSPLATWNKAIPAIHGEHYRVSDVQQRMWRKRFDFSGIPTYIIFNKQGKQTYKTSGFPGVDVLRTELAKNN